MEKNTSIPIEECRRVFNQKTPHGGVRLAVYYIDENGSPCRPKNANRTRVIETDENGNTIFEFYGAKP